MQLLTRTVVMILLSQTLVACGGSSNSDTNPDTGPTSDLHEVSIDEDNELSATLPDAADGVHFTLTQTVTHGSLTLDNDNGQYRYIPAANFNGIDSFNYVVDDNGNISDTKTVQITVNPINDPPVLPGVGILNATVDSPWSIGVTATDADNDELSFSVVGPDWLSIDPTTGVMSGTPSIDDVAIHAVAISVSDGIATQTNYVMLTVSNISDVQGKTDSANYNISFGDILFTVEVENTSSRTRVNWPLSFGQAFVKSDLTNIDSLKVFDDSGNELPLQINVKNRWDNNSLKHGLISLIVPNINANSNSTLYFVAGDTSFSSAATLSKADYLALGHNLSIDLTESGTTYSASIDDNFENANVTQWQQGAICSEWIIPAPLKTSGGTEHSHLKTYFHLKLYNTNDIQVSVIVENSYGFYEEKGASVPFTHTHKNITYDWQVKDGINVIDSGSSLEHFSHARWRKVYSTFAGTSGGLEQDPLDVTPGMDKVYLIKSKAVASYDINSAPDESLLNKIESELIASDTEPMGTGMIYPEFHSGAEASIDAAWSVDYLLSGDNRAYRAMIKNANAAGSIGIHFRNEQISDPQTGTVISVVDYPLATTRSDSANIPYFDGDQANPDTAHQNSFAYLPYVVTGDYYLLEELLFWSNWNELEKNVGKRNADGARGLIIPNQIGGQAWALRSLINAAFITPDDHPLKTYFNSMVDYNISWYTDHYVANSAPLHNQYGLLTYGLNENTGISSSGFTSANPWMDNGVTAVAARAYNMGFTDILPFLQWKSKFPVGLMTSPDYCYIFASNYEVFMRDGIDQPLYSDWATVYQKTLEVDFNQTGGAGNIAAAECGSQEMADLLNDSGKFAYGTFIAGQMLYTTNVSESYFGQLQGAVAAAVDTGVSGGQSAWKALMGSTVLLDYNTYKSRFSYNNGNKYNIVPYSQNFP